MLIEAALLPVFVQVALTFGLMFWMGRERLSALKRGETKIRDVALREPNWPARPMQVANAFSNQFELPTLFYVLVLLALFTRKADYLFVMLSWIFVVLRIAQAGIHTTSNNVQHRFAVFLIGALVLLMMWVIFAVRLLTGT